MRRKSHQVFCKLAEEIFPVPRPRPGGTAEPDLLLPPMSQKIFRVPGFALGLRSPAPASGERSAAAVRPRQNPAPRRPRRFFRPIAAGILVGTVALAGCSSIRPQPFSAAEVKGALADGVANARLGVEPLQAPLTLEESIARALKYNLAQRARQMEQAIALDLWKSGSYDLLPRAVAMAGYRSRDNDLVSRSKDSVTGAPSLAHPFISSSRDYELYDLGFSWSALDFTVGYYTARQNADRVLVALEQRRKAMHVLSRDVTIAFWRMASAQRLRDDVRRTIADAEAALADASQANAESLRSPVDNLRYQRQILENIRLLSTIDKEFATARFALANLVNAPLDAEFSVVEPDSRPNIAILDVPPAEMEETALLQNADLKEQLYQQRIAAQEVRKALARLLPNLALNYDLKYNTDNYLINQSWNEAGLLVSQNLTALLAAPAQRRAAQAGVELARQRRLAAQMALLTQVHIARLELASTFRQLQLADRIWDLDQNIGRHAANREEAQADSKLTKIAADTASIVSMLRRYQALAEFHAASGALQSTLGREIDLDSVASRSLPELTAAVRHWQDDWQSGHLAAPGSL